MSQVQGVVAGLREEDLTTFVLAQRWFGSKSREVAHVNVIESTVAREQEPGLAVALVEIRFHPGTHETYHVPVGVRSAESGWSEGRIAEVDGQVLYDATADPELVAELAAMMREQRTLEAPEGATMEFCSVSEVEGELEHPREIRPMGVEQSNTSLVFDDRLVLKLYRRLEPGVNPELELLRFLTEHGFPNIPALEGWAQYLGKPMDATLATLQHFVASEGDGWKLALDSLGGDPEAFLGRVRRLGEVTGAMHTVLASDSSDGAFCPEEPSGEALALLVATVDEEIEELFLSLPDDPALAPIAGRGEEVREQLRLASHAGGTGRVIRHHGDYHLGQVLWADDDWVVIDFEGEPARGLTERRRKRSPLRDVAGMLRSFAYAASASELERDVKPPGDWEQRARAEFLAGYLDEVDSSIVPSGQAFERLLALFELEKAVYELRYELDNRPDWVRIPVAGIARLLELDV
jgi:trehalose synthase-fused probable maltokinase